MVVAIGATEQDAYPPRVLVSVTGLTVGDSVELYRVADGVRTLMRGASTEAVEDPSYLVVDAELPFGVPVSYVAVVEGVTEYSTGATTYVLPGGNVAITDAITGAAAEVIVGGAGEKSYARDATRFRVGGRNLVVSGELGQAEGSYELFVATSGARENLMAVLAGATQGIVQIRQPGVSASTGDPYGGIDAYLAVDRVTERRFSQDGSDPRRLVTIEYAEVGGWADVLTARGFTYQDVADFYGSGTYADAAADYPTYLAAAQADWSP